MLRKFAYASALVGCLLLAESCFGQTTLTCSSNDGRRHYCQADTRGGITLTRQISGSPCQQGYSWGFDRNGVWVDRGCRAEFQTMRYQPAQNLTCSSDDGRRHYCGADTRGGVRMVRQRSGSPCQQGSTWGYDSRGVWVDRGCRADFEVGGGSGGYQPQPLQSLTCSSDDGRRHYCNANTRGGVRMVRQRSGSPCQQGSTWGYDDRGVWVDRGCRADFEIGGGGGFRPPIGGGGARTFRCSSDDGGRHYCDADTRGGIRMVRQISGSPCQQGSTWGYDRRGVWVDRGCRAEFQTGR